MIRTLLRALPAAALLWCSLPAEAQDLTALSAVNKLSDGGFEGAAPSYWNPTGAGATWSTAQAHSGTHSLALSGAGEATWTQAEVIRNWVSAFPANTALTLKAWVYAEGVNTAPATDADKYQMVATFRDANNADILGAPVVVDLPQASASYGWTQISTAALGDITLPVPATSVTVSVRKGASATGTMYIDDFSVDGSGWHGANVDLPGDWFTYWPGFDSGQADPHWIVAKTTAESHTGGASLQIEREGAPLPGEETVVISPLVPVTSGRPVLISFWVKTSGNASPETIGTGGGDAAADNNIGLSALWYNSLQTGSAGYDQFRLGGADIRLNGEYNPQVIPLLPRQADNGWTQYSFVLNPLPGSVGLELRLRYWHQFTGATYWDDVFIGDVDDVTAQVPDLLPEATAGFEGTTPSYWNPTGAGATWSTAQAHSGTHSLALSGAGEATWTQAEVIRNWVSAFPANTALTLKAWVYAEGVNTAPATDADKYQMVATFRDANNADILGAPVVVDLPQASASYGWTQISTAALGDITLPVPATSVTVSVRKGASATGTMYIDDFSVDGSGWHGANVDLPGDWFTYWPGFDSGQADPHWIVAKTTAESHTGGASLQIEREGAPLPGEETVVITPLTPVTTSEPVLISFWVKTSGNASPETIGTGGGDAAADNNIGLSALWYNSLQTGSAGYDQFRLGGADIRLNGEYNPQVIPLLPRQADNDWTNYAFVLNPLPGSVGLELRLRYWHQFTGATYWDDVSITNVGGSNLLTTAGEEAPAPGETAAAGERWMRANAPNPFGDRTEIRFSLPNAEPVTLEVYDLLGRRVALLADNAPMAAADHAVAFDRAGLSSGTYLVVLRTPSHSEARQITVVR